MILPGDSKYLILKHLRKAFHKRSESFLKYDTPNSSISSHLPMNLLNYKKSCNMFWFLAVVAGGLNKFVWSLRSNNSSYNLVSQILGDTAGLCLSELKTSPTTFIKKMWNSLTRWSTWSLEGTVPCTPLTVTGKPFTSEFFIPSRWT